MTSCLKYDILIITQIQKLETNAFFIYSYSELNKLLTKVDMKTAKNRDKTGRSRDGVVSFKERHTLAFKLIASILLFSFILYDIGWALGDLALTVPQELGSPKDTYVNGSKETIINIQDAHASLSAQHSIVNLLEDLTKNYNLNLIALEGAEGPLDVSVLRSFPDAGARRESAEYLMRKGRMSAGEFFSIVSENPIKTYGIEDNALYKANLDAFKGVIADKVECVRNIDALIDTLRVLEVKVYSKDLLKLEENSRLHRDGSLAFIKHWELLKDLSEKKRIRLIRFKNVTKLLETTELEKQIDFKKATKERKALIDNLTKALPKKELEKLVLKSLAFKKEEIPQAEFHNHILELAGSMKLDTSGYPNLIKFADYINSYDQIDLLSLLEEIEKVETHVRESVYGNAEEKALCEFSKVLAVIKRLFSINLTNSDYEFIAQNRRLFDKKAVSEFIKVSYRKYSLYFDRSYDIDLIFNRLDEAIEFYNIAQKRNNAMIANTIKAMRQNGEQVAALITGGFHSRGLSKLMKEKGLSYMILMPKFEPGEKHKRPYIAVLTNKRQPYDDLIEEGKYTLAMEAFCHTADPNHITLPLALDYARGYVMVRYPKGRNDIMGAKLKAELGIEKRYSQTAVLNAEDIRLEMNRLKAIHYRRFKEIFDARPSEEWNETRPITALDTLAELLGLAIDGNKGVITDDSGNPQTTDTEVFSVEGAIEKNQEFIVIVNQEEGDDIYVQVDKTTGALSVVAESSTEARQAQLLIKGSGLRPVAPPRTSTVSGKLENITDLFAPPDDAVRDIKSTIITEARNRVTRRYRELANDGAGTDDLRLEDGEIEEALTGAIRAKEAVHGYRLPSDWRQQSDTAGVIDRLIAEIRDGLFSSEPPSDEPSIAGIKTELAKDDRAGVSLDKMSSDPKLENPYQAALYFIERGIAGVTRPIRNCFKWTNGSPKEPIENYLGELVAARSLERNIKYSRVIRFSDTRYGSEVDCLLEVDSSKYTDNESGEETVADGVYLVEVKTGSAKMKAHMIAVGAKEEKFTNYKFNAARMRHAGYDVKGVIFAVGGDTVRVLSYDFYMEEGRREKALDLDVYSAFVPDIIIKRRGTPNAPWPARDPGKFAGSITDDLLIAEAIDPDYAEESHRLLSEAAGRRSPSYVRRLIAAGLERRGLTPFNWRISRKKKEAWGCVFDLLIEELVESDGMAEPVEAARTNTTDEVPESDDDAIEALLTNLLQSLSEIELPDGLIPKPGETIVDRGIKMLDFIAANVANVPFDNLVNATTLLFSVVGKEASMDEFPRFVGHATNHALPGILNRRSMSPDALAPVNGVVADTLLKRAKGMDECPEKAEILSTGKEYALAAVEGMDLRRGSLDSEDHSTMEIQLDTRRILKEYHEEEEEHGKAVALAMESLRYYIMDPESRRDWMKDMADSYYYSDSPATARFIYELILRDKKVPDSGKIDVVLNLVAIYRQFYFYRQPDLIDKSKELLERYEAVLNEITIVGDEGSAGSFKGKLPRDFKKAVLMGILTEKALVYAFSAGREGDIDPAERRKDCEVITTLYPGLQQLDNEIAGSGLNIKTKEYLTAVLAALKIQAYAAAGTDDYSQKAGYFAEAVASVPTSYEIEQADGQADGIKRQQLVSLKMINGDLEDAEKECLELLNDAKGFLRLAVLYDYISVLKRLDKEDEARKRAAEFFEHFAGLKSSDEDAGDTAARLIAYSLPGQVQDVMDVSMGMLDTIEGWRSVRPAGLEEMISFCFFYAGLDIDAFTNDVTTIVIEGKGRLRSPRDEHLRAVVSAIWTENSAVAVFLLRSLAFITRDMPLGNSLTGYLRERAAADEKACETPGLPGHLTGALSLKGIMVFTLLAQIIYESAGQVEGEHNLFLQLAVNETLNTHLAARDDDPLYAIKKIGASHNDFYKIVGSDHTCFYYMYSSFVRVVAQNCERQPRGSVEHTEIVRGMGPFLNQINHMMAASYADKAAQRLKGDLAGIEPGENNIGFEFHFGAAKLALNAGEYEFACDWFQRMKRILDDAGKTAKDNPNILQALTSYAEVLSYHGGADELRTADAVVSEWAGAVSGYVDAVETGRPLPEGVEGDHIFAVIFSSMAAIPLTFLIKMFRDNKDAHAALRKLTPVFLSAMEEKQDKNRSDFSGILNIASISYLLGDIDNFKRSIAIVCGVDAPVERLVRDIGSYKYLSLMLIAYHIYGTPEHQDDEKAARAREIADAIPATCTPINRVEDTSFYSSEAVLYMTRGDHDEALSVIEAMQPELASRGLKGEILRSKIIISVIHKLRDGDAGTALGILRGALESEAERLKSKDTYDKKLANLQIRSVYPVFVMALPPDLRHEAAELIATLLTDRNGTPLSKEARYIACNMLEMAASEEVGSGLVSHIEDVAAGRKKFDPYSDGEIAALLFRLPGHHGAIAEFTVQSFCSAGHVKQQGGVGILNTLAKILTEARKGNTPDEYRKAVDYFHSRERYAEALEFIVLAFQAAKTSGDDSKADALRHIRQDASKAYHACEDMKRSYTDNDFAAANNNAEALLGFNKEDSTALHVIANCEQLRAARRQINEGKLDEARVTLVDITASIPKIPRSENVVRSAITDVDKLISIRDNATIRLENRQHRTAVEEPGVGLKNASGMAPLKLTPPIGRDHEPFAGLYREADNIEHEGQELLAGVAEARSLEVIHANAQRLLSRYPDLKDETFQALVAKSLEEFNAAENMKEAQARQHYKRAFDIARLIYEYKGHNPDTKYLRKAQQIISHASANIWILEIKRSYFYIRAMLIAEEKRDKVDKHKMLNEANAAASQRHADGASAAQRHARRRSRRAEPEPKAVDEIALNFTSFEPQISGLVVSGFSGIDVNKYARPGDTFKIRFKGDEERVEFLQPYFRVLSVGGKGDSLTLVLPTVSGDQRQQLIAEWKHKLINGGTLVRVPNSSWMNQCKMYDQIMPTLMGTTLTHLDDNYENLRLARAHMQKDMINRVLGIHIDIPTARTEEALRAEQEGAGGSDGLIGLVDEKENQMAQAARADGEDFVLDPEQKAAIINGLTKSRKITLIQGPGGTGKTESILFIIDLITKLGGSVNIYSQTNPAVDNICVKRQSRGEFLVRVGNDESAIDPRIMEDCWLKKGELLQKIRDKETGTCHVVLATINGFALDHDVQRMRSAKPRDGKDDSFLKKVAFVIVDEATRATVPELLWSLYDMEGIEKVVLVGDHFQLPAHGISAEDIASAKKTLYEEYGQYHKVDEISVPRIGDSRSVEELFGKEGDRQRPEMLTTFMDEFKISLFEKILDLFDGDGGKIFDVTKPDFHALLMQRRSGWLIVEKDSYFYESVGGLRYPRGAEPGVVIHDETGGTMPEDKVGKDLTGTINIGEITRAITWVDWLMNHENLETKDIAVITPYARQVACLDEAFIIFSRLHGYLRAIETGTTPPANTESVIEALQKTLEVSGIYPDELSLSDYIKLQVIHTNGERALGEFRKKVRAFLSNKSPKNAQALREELRLGEKFVPEYDLENGHFSIQTIDSAIGSEWEAIVFSWVRSNRPGFVELDNFLQKVEDGEWIDRAPEEIQALFRVRKSGQEVMMSPIRTRLERLHVRSGRQYKSDIEHNIGRFLSEPTPESARLLRIDLRMARPNYIRIQKYLERIVTEGALSESVPRHIEDTLKSPEMEDIGFSLYGDSGDTFEEYKRRVNGFIANPNRERALRLASFLQMAEKNPRSLGTRSLPAEDLEECSVGFLKDKVDGWKRRNVATARPRKYSIDIADSHNFLNADSDEVRNWWRHNEAIFEKATPYLISQGYTQDQLPSHMKLKRSRRGGDGRSDRRRRRRSHRGGRGRDRGRGDRRGGGGRGRTSTVAEETVTEAREPESTALKPGALSFMSDAWYYKFIIAPIAEEVVKVGLPYVMLMMLYPGGDEVVVFSGALFMAAAVFLGTVFTLFHMLNTVPASKIENEDFFKEKALRFKEAFGKLSDEKQAFFKKAFRNILYTSGGMFLLVMAFSIPLSTAGFMFLALHILFQDLHILRGHKDDPVTINALRMPAWVSTVGIFSGILSAYAPSWEVFWYLLACNAGFHLLTNIFVFVYNLIRPGRPLGYAALGVVIDDLSPELKPIGNIANNLAYSWDPEFKKINERARNILARGNPKDPNIPDLITKYEEYLQGGAQQQENSGQYHLEEDERIAYFSMEYGMTNDLNIYSGGLGILSGDHLRGLSDEYSNGTFVSVGLAWGRGYFRQEIDKLAWQMEYYPEVPFREYGEIVRDNQGNEIRVIVNFPDGKDIFARVWRLRCGRTELYLLDTNIKDNPDRADRDLTANLYVDDHERRWRFMQEYLLGIGGMKLLDRLGIKPAALHLNEGHAAFAAVELLRKETEDRARALGFTPGEAARMRAEGGEEEGSEAYELGITFEQVREAVAAKVVFTSHTPVPSGNEMFDEWLYDYYIGNYSCQPDFDSLFFHKLKEIAVYPEKGNKVNLSKLALALSSYCNGVSRINAGEARELYGESWNRLHPASENRDYDYDAVTNAVHRKFWQAKPLQDLLERYLNGQQGEALFLGKTLDELTKDELDTLLGAVPTKELMAVKKAMKKEAADRLKRIYHYKRHKCMDNPKIGPNLLETTPSAIDKISGEEDVFTIVISRRFAGYKRLGLILNILKKLKQDAAKRGLKLQIVFAGKAHPDDNPGKDTIRWVHSIMRQTDLNEDNIFFVPDYDIETAKCLLELADVWQNNPLPPLEASGTSGMKAYMNGVLNLTTFDGWCPERDPESRGVMFIGLNILSWYKKLRQHRKDGRIDRHNRLLQKIESRELVDMKSLYPGIMDMRVNDDDWAGVMRDSIADAMANFNTRRLIKEYADKAYTRAVTRGRDMDRSFRHKAEEIRNAKERAERAIIAIRSLSHSPATDITNIMTAISMEPGSLDEVYIDDRHEIAELLDKINLQRTTVREVSLQHMPPNDIVGGWISKLGLFLEKAIEIRKTLEIKYNRYLDGKDKIISDANTDKFERAGICMDEVINILDNRVRFANARPLRQETDLVKVVTDACRPHCGFFGDDLHDNVKINDLTEGFLSASIDERSVLNSIANIVENAREAVSGRPNGRVEISINKNERHAVIIIDDNGVPISDRMLEEAAYGVPRLFCLNETEGKEFGTGLGLAEAYKTITAHGGTIELDTSRREGKAFIVKLPMITTGLGRRTSERKREAVVDPVRPRIVLDIPTEVLKSQDDGRRINEALKRLNERVSETVEASFVEVLHEDAKTPSTTVKDYGPDIVIPVRSNITVDELVEEITSNEFVTEINTNFFDLLNPDLAQLTLEGASGMTSERLESAMKRLSGLLNPTASMDTLRFSAYNLRMANTARRIMTQNPLTKQAWSNITQNKTPKVMTVGIRSLGELKMLAEAHKERMALALKKQAKPIKLHVRLMVKDAGTRDQIRENKREILMRMNIYNTVLEPDDLTVFVEEDTPDIETIFETCKERYDTEKITIVDHLDEQRELSGAAEDLLQRIALIEYEDDILTPYVYDEAIKLINRPGRHMLPRIQRINLDRVRDEITQYDALFTSV